MSFVPRDRRITLLLLILFALLVVYILWTRDPIGYVILILLAVFIALPAAILFIALRREGRSLRDLLPEREDEETTRE